MSVSEPSDSQTPATPTSEPSNSAPLKSSALFLALDILLAVGVCLLAFLLASFAVKNSDFWQHLATGRLVAEGNYNFGSDPFSYTTEGRTWVNHSWLYGTVFYFIFTSFGGSAVVVLKATLIALTTFVILLIRKPGHNLFFSVFAVTLALLAAAPRLLLQPHLFSMFFLVVTLYQVLLWNKAEDRKRLAVGLAITFCLWSNCDQWFFVGPITVALYLLGEFVQQTLTKTKYPSQGTASVTTLFTGLMVGVLACMINPHHVQVWRLPAELIDTNLAAIAETDREFSGVFRSLFNENAFDFSGQYYLTNPINDWAFLLSTMLAMLGFAMNTNLRWGMALVWLGLFGITIWYQRFTPLFVLSSAIFAAWNLSEFAARFSERSFSPQGRTFFTLIGAVGRTLAIFSGLAMLFFSRDGSLHPLHREPELARYVAWSVEPDEALERAAKTIQTWREEGKLPEKARGIYLQYDLAHYVAWFAPLEKNFFDLRWNLHKPEMQTMVNFRQVFAPRTSEVKAPEKEVLEAMKEYGISYLVCSNNTRNINIETVSALWRQYRVNPDGTLDQPVWPLWHLDGRVVIVGWLEQKTLSSEQFKAMAFNPIEQAFSSNSKKLPPMNEGMIRIPFQREFFDRYWNPPQPLSTDAEEAALLFEYQRLQRELFLEQQRRIGFAMMSVMGTSVIPTTLFPPALPVPPNMLAISTLAMRAGRRAIASSPEHPDGYATLGNAYDNRLSTTQDIQLLMVLSNYQRALKRSNPDDPPRRSRLAMFPIAEKVFQIHLSEGRLDCAFQSLQLLQKYLINSPLPGMTQGQIDQILKSIQDFKLDNRPVQEAIKKRLDALENVTVRVNSPLVRATVAKGFGLHLEALNILQQVDLSDSSSISLSEKVAVVIDMIQLLIACGEIEKAYQLIQQTDKDTSTIRFDPRFRQEYANVRQLAFQQSYQILETSQIQADPFIPELDANRAFQYLKLNCAIIVGDFELVNKLYEERISAIRLAIQQTFPDLLAQRSKNLNMLPPQNVTSYVQFLDIITRPPIPWEARILSPVMAEVGLVQLYTFRDLIQALGDVLVRTGLTHLEQGNIAEAKKYFEEALRPAGLEYNYPTRVIADQYLRVFK